MAASSTGNCYICGAELGKTAMKTHLLKHHGEDGGGQECYLLQIEGAYNKDYWLFIEIPLEKTLSAVDGFLRKIWLECCGHMSAFYGSGRMEVGKSRKMGAFPVGTRLMHEYDFGSTTETVIKIMGLTMKKPQKGVVRLLARNTPPRFKCADCDSPAEFICVERIDDSDNPFCCAECGESLDMLLPVTNSPRMGVCGYDGELDDFAFDFAKVSQKKL